MKWHKKPELRYNYNSLTKKPGVWSGNGLNTVRKQSWKKIGTKLKNQSNKENGLEYTSSRAGMHPKGQAPQLICLQILIPLGEQCVSPGCQQRRCTRATISYCSQLT